MRKKRENERRGERKLEENRIRRREEGLVG